MVQTLVPQPADIAECLLSPREAPALLDGEAFCSKLQWYTPPRRAYSRRELLADRCVNFVGAGLALVGAPLLGYASWSAGNAPLKQISMWVFAAGLVIMMTCSAAYHYWAWDWPAGRRLLSLDHVGISAMIMGGYAPVMLQCGCPGVLVFVWSVGIGGLIWEVVEARKPTTGVPKGNIWTALDAAHVVRYLVMGWAVVVVWNSVSLAVPQNVRQLAVIAGITYTLGVPFFAWHGMEYHLVVWHTFVLCASFWVYLMQLELTRIGPPGTSTGFLPATNPGIFGPR